MLGSITLLKILTAATVLMGAGVGYTAVFNNDGDNSLSNRLSEYLSLDVAQVEKPENVLPSEPNSPAPETPNPDENTTPGDDNTNPELNTDGDSGPGATENTSGDIPEIVYTVKDGDTYGCIAEARYGSFEHWVDIVRVNPTDRVGFGEYDLHVGAQIVLPAITKASLKPTSSLCT